jgi:excisionase family DNA binding protein
MSDIVQLLTLLDVAKVTCVSSDTVRKWVREGKLKPTKIRRRLLFAPAELARFLEGSK